MPAETNWFWSSSSSPQHTPQRRRWRSYSGGTSPSSSKSRTHSWVAWGSDATARGRLSNSGWLPCCPGRPCCRPCARVCLCSSCLWRTSGSGRWSPSGMRWFLATRKVCQPLWDSTDPVSFSSVSARSTSLDPAWGCTTSASSMWPSHTRCLWCHSSNLG